NRATQDVGMDLHPQPALRATAAGEQTPNREAVGFQVLQDAARAEGGRLVDAAEDMAGTMCERQAPQNAAAPGVPERATGALPAVEADQPVAARRYGGRPGVEHLVDVTAGARGLGRLVAGEVLAIPVQDRPGRRLPALQRVESLDHGVGVAAGHAAAEQLP